MNALDVEEVSHRYGDREALRSVSFTVPAGGTFGLLGPNGGGKTTLFKIVSTLVAPSSGAVRVFGDPVAERPHDVRRSLGVVFQAPALDRRLTVDENLRHHGRLYGLRGDRLDARVGECLALVRLGDRRRDLVGSLSGGLQRRVELAKALVHEPRLLVLDEPSTGLDPGARRDVWEHLAWLKERGDTTIVLTTHLMEEAAKCDRVGILHQGRLVALGSPDALTAEIGGDVILIAASAPQALLPRVAARFHVKVEVVEGRLRLERPRAHEFITSLVEAFPGEIDAVTFGKPTLEDVFIHHTGRTLRD